MRTVTIHPAAITHNLHEVKRRAPQSKVLAMVKANAYGHGVSAVLPALAEADGIGVAILSEALEARSLGWDKTIGLIEGVFSEDDWHTAIKHDIGCVIHHQPQLDWALASAPPADSATRTVWLKYNTGMNRLGFDDTALISAATALHAAGYQLILTTHFANADVKAHPLNAKQIQRFTDMLAYLQTHISADIQGSLCNSAAIVSQPEHHFDWVRPGIMLYGGSPITEASAAELSLRPAMTFASQVIAIHTVKAGDAIGYSSLWTASVDTRVALISAGYGDGYPRVIDSEADVVIHGQTKAHCCPIRGRVAMDMMVIDIEAAGDDIRLGDTVTLWGDAPHVDTVASYAHTISYELLCRLSPRATRQIH
ncbi:alanine racemase [Psychrobacter aestuarii]|uniref:Alanine racemase n=1 Tax=Psychrobacter aestuarii TaxID=556327 RepID=A0ABN0VNW5_9GAMM|nr:alanine racemase [Psychrobacter aestuarii]